MISMNSIWLRYEDILIFSTWVETTTWSSLMANTANALWEIISHLIISH